MNKDASLNDLPSKPFKWEKPIQKLKLYINILVGNVGFKYGDLEDGKVKISFI